MRKTRKVSLAEADFSEEEINRGLEGLEGWLSQKKALGTTDNPLLLPEGISEKEIVDTLKARVKDKSFGQNDTFEDIFISYLQGQKKK